MKKEVLDALNSTNLRILKRTNKIKASYEDLYSSDEIDEFDQNKNICHQIDWNVRNNNSTIYILKTYQFSDKIICSIDNIQSKIKYNYICNYGLLFSFSEN